MFCSTYEIKYNGLCVIFICQKGQFGKKWLLDSNCIIIDKSLIVMFCSVNYIASSLQWKHVLTIKSRDNQKQARVGLLLPAHLHWNANNHKRRETGNKMNSLLEPLKGGFFPIAPWTSLFGTMRITQTQGCSAYWSMRQLIHCQGYVRCQLIAQKTHWNPILAKKIN